MDATPGMEHSSPEEPALTGDIGLPRIETIAAPEHRADDDEDLGPMPPIRNIMDVLFPATPPEPRNPRVIRRFDY